MKHTMIFA